VENAWLISLIWIIFVDNWEAPGLDTYADKRSTVAWELTKPAMGGSRDGCNGTRHSAIEPFCMDSEAYKICEGWATEESDTAFSWKCKEEWVLTNSLLFRWLVV
jgi:hypothetical protein